MKEIGVRCFNNLVDWRVCYNWNISLRLYFKKLLQKRDTYLRTEPKKGGTDLRMEPVIQSMVTAEESNIDRLKYTLNEQKGPGS